MSSRTAARLARTTARHARVIAVDLESVNGKEGIVAAGLYYVDVTLHAPGVLPRVTNTGSQFNQFRGLIFPTDGDGSLYDPTTRTARRPRGPVTSYGHFDPETFEEFWLDESKIPRDLYNKLLDGAGDPDTGENDAGWQSVFDTIDTWCREAVVDGRVPVIVSDNIVFDLAVVDTHMTRLGHPGITQMYSDNTDNRSWTPVRSPNTAIKLNRASDGSPSDDMSISFPLFTPEVERPHHPVSDACKIAHEYASFIAARGRLE